MATIGLDRLYYAKITENDAGEETYGTPSQLAKAISADLSVELAEATLYADDGASEIVKEFKSGTLSLGIDDIGSAAASDLTGATIDKNKVLISASEDGGDPVAVGFRAKKSNGKYIPPRVFKEMTRLTKQKTKLEELLSGVNAFNAKGKAAEIGAFLDKYIPAVEQMHTTLKKYNTAFTVTTAENKKLKKKTEQLEQSLDKATQESTLKKLADAKLHRDYEDAVAVLDRIPKEVLAAYTHRTEKERETAYGR